MHEWLSAGAAAAYIGPRRAGRPTSPLTVRRWWNVGLCGVVLRSERRGGLTCTTGEWIGEFFHRVEAVRRAEKEQRRAELPPPPCALKKRRAASAKRRAKMGI